MPIFKIQHLTQYKYDRQVKESVNEIKIYPYQSKDQEVLQQEIVITGTHQIHTYLEYWGNKTGAFNLLAAHNELRIESQVMVRTTQPAEMTVNFLTGFEDLHREVHEDLQKLELASPDAIALQSDIEQILQTVYHTGKSVAATVGDCCTFIFKNFSYIKGITTVETTVDQILEQKAGVCQDFVHVMLQVLRTLQIPSRYVSGYICPNKNGMRGEGATHAWVEAWIPQYGWAGVDPTNNVWVTNTHVKLAVGKSFYDCSPVKGTFKGPANQQLSVFVAVAYEDGHQYEELNNVRGADIDPSGYVVDQPGMAVQQQ